MNGEQKPLKKTLSLMGMDILDDETRKKLNGMMRQAIQADATETAPAKYMAVSGLTSYCVGAWLFSLSGDWNALFAVGGVMAVLSAGFILYDERTAKKRAKAKAQAEIARWEHTEKMMDSCSELLRDIGTLNRLLDDEVAVNKELKERLYALEDSLLDDAALEGGAQKA